MKIVNNFDDGSIEIQDDSIMDIPSVMSKGESDLSEREENKLHLDQLKDWVKAMDDEELKTLTNSIPVSFIIERISEELNDKMKMEERINQMYADLIKRG